jgi:hypothetical protein
MMVVQPASARIGETMAGTKKSVEKGAKKKAKAHTRYYLEGKKLAPGLTTVLGLLNKPALVRWANKLGLEGVSVDGFVSELASIGSLGHALITDSLIEADTDTSDYTTNQIDAAENSVLSFLAWTEEHPISETFWVEKPLVSEVHRFGGTADIYCLIKGSMELIELKTGKGIYPEHIYQAAAQKMLLEENDCRVDRCRVLNIPRSEDESFLEHVLTDKEIRIGQEIFQHCLAIYYLKKEERNA